MLDRHCISVSPGVKQKSLSLRWGLRGEREMKILSAPLNRITTSLVGRCSRVFPRTELKRNVFKVVRAVA